MCKEVVQRTTISVKKAPEKVLAPATAPQLEPREATCRPPTGGWAGVRARERMVLGLELHSEMGWADTAEGPVGQTSQLDPASLPSLWGRGSQLDPVGLQDPGGASPLPPPQVLQGLWGPRLGRDGERSLGWGLVRKGTLKTQNRKKTNGKTCSPPQTEAGVRTPFDDSPFPLFNLGEEKEVDEVTDGAGTHAHDARGSSPDGRGPQPVRAAPASMLCTFTLWAASGGRGQPLCF